MNLTCLIVTDSAIGAILLWMEIRLCTYQQKLDNQSSIRVGTYVTLVAGCSNTSPAGSRNPATIRFICSSHWIVAAWTMLCHINKSVSHPSNQREHNRATKWQRLLVVTTHSNCSPVRNIRALVFDPMPSPPPRRSRKL